MRTVFSSKNNIVHQYWLYVQRLIIPLFSLTVKQHFLLYKLERDERFTISLETSDHFRKSLLVYLTVELVDFSLSLTAALTCECVIFRVFITVHAAEL